MLTIEEPPAKALPVDWLIPESVLTPDTTNVLLQQTESGEFALLFFQHPFPAKQEDGEQSPATCVAKLVLSPEFLQASLPARCEKIKTIDPSLVNNAEDFLALEQKIEDLKKRYHFWKDEYEFISIEMFLRHHPALIADLDKIYELKCQYLGDLPVRLECVDETGRIEDATLFVTIEVEEVTQAVKESVDRISEEKWKTLSKESITNIFVGWELL
jgi:hypothetical protein